MFYWYSSATVCGSSVCACKYNYNIIPVTHCIILLFTIFGCRNENIIIIIACISLDVFSSFVTVAYSHGNKLYIPLFRFMGQRAKNDIDRGCYLYMSCVFIYTQHE